jgi:hypothetical protein
VVEIDNIGTG